MLELLGSAGALGALDGSLILASSGDSEGDIRYLGLLLLFSGFVFYGFVYFRYRNSDKRHKHESETEATMLDVRAADNQINTLKGVSNARLKGANNHVVHGAKQGFLEGTASNAVNDALRRLPGRP